MTLTAAELAKELNKHLSPSLFEELTDLLEEGDVSSLYEEMAEIEVTRNPDKYCSFPYLVEYDLNYSGGNYSGVGQVVTVMAPAWVLVPKCFTKQTGIDSIHIVSYQESDEAVKDL